MPSLLGGSLGGLLSNIAGILLIGNQEFSVAAKDGNATILQGDSNSASGFDTDELRVVVNGTNDYFLAVSPNAPYNSVRIDNRIGSLLGLGNTRKLGVYSAFYTQGNGACGLPSYTSFSGSGLTLDLLNIGGAGVTDPHLVLDGNPNTFSKLGLGIIGVAAQIEQTVYFDTLSDTNDNFYINLAINPSLLQAGIANNIEVLAQNGSQPVFSGNLASLLNVDLLGLLQNGNSATIGFDPGASVDRVTIRLSSLLGIGLDQQIRISDVYRAPAPPTIDQQSENVSICKGASADLVAETQSGSNAELRWYDAPAAGNLLATVNSGETFTSPVLNADVTYYVASGKVGCTEESPRAAVTVHVVDIPTANDIQVIGNQDPICSLNDVVLLPTSTIAGTFSWYFDANGTTPITDGLVSGGATYTVDTNGVLTVNGLNEANGPYTFFVRLTEASAGCQNAIGDLKPVVVNIVDSNNSASVSLDSSITLTDLLNIFQGSNLKTLSGTVVGNIQAGNTISLLIDGKVYSGLIDSNLGFNITVDGNDLVNDTDHIAEVLIDGTPCTISTEVLIELPKLPTVDLTQLFCASSNPTLADLQVNGQDLVFFDSLSGNVQLDMNTPLIDGGVYFAGILNIPATVLSRLTINVQLVQEEQATISGQLEEACMERSYTYTTESNKQNYVWDVAGGTITDGGTATDDFVTVTWDSLQDTTIHVSYENDFGCPSEMSIDVAVVSCGEVMGEEFCLFVYNEFTPNNDGFNDFFEIKCIENYSSTVQVYNRNGNLVFKAHDYQNNWDGVANVGGVLNAGDQLPSGTYYYVIRIPELKRELNGWLQLAR